MPKGVDFSINFLYAGEALALNHRMPESTAISKESAVWRSSVPLTRRIAERMSLLTCISCIVGSMLSEAALSCNSMCCGQQLFCVLFSLQSDSRLAVSCRILQQQLIQQGSIFPLPYSESACATVSSLFESYSASKQHLLISMAQHDTMTHAGPAISLCFVQSQSSDASFNKKNFTLLQPVTVSSAFGICSVLLTPGPASRVLTT